MNDTTSELLASEIAALKREMAEIKSQLSKEAIPLAPSSGGTGTSSVLTQGSVPIIGASGVFTEDASNLRFEPDGALTLTKIKISPEGGLLVQLTVGTGTIYRGEIVCISQSGSNKCVYKNPTSGNEFDMPIGVVYDLSRTAGQTVWVCVSGITYVLPETSATATRGYVIYTSSSEVGRGAQAATVPVAATHFREIGHFIETASAVNTWGLAVLHFN